MNRRWNGVLVLGAIAVCFAGPAGAGAEGGLADRRRRPAAHSWQRNETILTKDNVKDMKLLWKIKLDNQPRQMHSLFPPLIAGNVSTPSGTRRSPSSPASPTTSTGSTSRPGG